METIIITGTKGFIGSNLKKELDGKYEIIEINEDVFDKSTWKDEVAKYFWLNIRCVFHIGACSNTLETNVNYMMLVNYEFTKHLMTLCRIKNVPMIYSSSAANYGVNNEYPSNLYGWSKYAAEDFVITNGGIGLRYFNVYGPGEENKGKMASVAFQMNEKFKNNEEIKLFPKKPRRDFVYVKDVISANIHAFENYKKLSGDYYEVGSGTARMFEDVMNIMNIPYEYHDENLIPKGYQFYTCSNKRKWMTDWKSKWSLEEGLKDYFNL
jgi:ADP-L-glycero-D-manno-heptose 6-epimerase